MKPLDENWLFGIRPYCIPQIDSVIIRRAKEVLKYWNDEKICVYWKKMNAIFSECRSDSYFDFDGVLYQGHSKQESDIDIFIRPTFNSGYKPFISLLKELEEEEVFRALKAKQPIDWFGCGYYAIASVLILGYAAERDIPSVCKLYGFIEPRLWEGFALRKICELRPMAKIGQKIIKSAKVGHKITHGDESEKRTKWDDYQEYINFLSDKNRHLSYSDLQKQAAKHFDVSEKTIQRHTTNPKERKQVVLNSE